MKALIIVDMQNDFMEGGPLAVPGAKALVPLINRLQWRFEFVVPTQDWHPAGHGSFAPNHPGRKPFEEIELNGLRQTLWPVHCVQDTQGADFVQQLNRLNWKTVIQKGTDQAVDSYSVFFDNGKRHATGLGEFLQTHDVDDVYLVGVATDYCVKFTALDALKQGLKVHVIQNACCGVDLIPGDVDRALEEMRQAGVHVMHSDAVPDFAGFTAKK